MRKTKNKSNKNYRVRSITTSRDKGIPLSFRILLPPNLADTAPMDAIMVQIEGVVGDIPISLEKLDKAIPYSLPQTHYRLIHLLERWEEGVPLHSLHQLSRQRLRKLLKIIRNEPVVFRPDKGEESLAWEDNELVGVHEFLEIEDEEAEVEPGGQDQPMVVDGSTQFLAITLPGKDDLMYDEALELVQQNGFKLEPSNGKWWLRDRHKTLNFLACHLNELEDEYDARLLKSFRKKIKTLKFAKVTAEAVEGNHDFTINMKLDVCGASEVAFRSNLARGQYYLQSPKGIVLVDPAQITKLERIQRALSGEADRSIAPDYSQSLSPMHLAYAESLVEEVSSNFKTPQAWKIRSKALRDISKLGTPPISKGLNKKLRKYQRLGTAWLWHLYKYNLAGILADEMGLGKTVQALAFIECLFNTVKEGEEKPVCLVVCPASLVENWRREANIFTPDLSAYSHHGPDRLKDIEDLRKKDIIITSYTTLSRDSALLGQIEYTTIIADEAQHIKNTRTQNAKTLKSMYSKGRVLLTGTPLENRLDDLYSLFDFLMPGYLVEFQGILTRDDRPWYDEQFRRQVAPYILRRSKSLVAPELPEKIQQTYYCDMNKKQAKLYKDYQKQTKDAIIDLERSGAKENQIRFAALSQLLRLRQVCAEPRILEEALKAEDSAKLRVFRELLEEAIDGQHKILVFSQFVSVLQFLKADLEELGVKYCYLDGKTQNRLDVCDRFNNDDSIPVFLISLKAGGSGLNLTGADTVIHYDPWWNPAVEAQATDRAHRIGQKKVVTSIKLIVSGSVEERVLEMQKSKAHLLKDILDASDAEHAKIGLKEIKDLIS